MKYYFLALQKYAEFKGRATRTEFWYFTLFNNLIMFAIMFLGVKIVGDDAVVIPYAIYAVGTLIPTLAVGVRRMHDTGNSGWFLLLPIYNLILAVTDSEKSPNKWGAEQNNY